MNPPISAYILAKNEESHIADAIKSIAWADEVLVIDTGSQDNTKSIAESLGAKVHSITFKGFGTTRNEAISRCKHDWIFCLDADERCSAALYDEITHLMNSTSPLDSSLFLAPRKNYFLGQWIKHSGWYPDYRHPVLFNKNTVRYTNDAVHESFIAPPGANIIYLKNALIHFPYQDLSHLLQKANLYSTLGVKRLSQKNKRISLANGLFHAVWAFFRQFIIRRGFLDGWPGFVLALNNFHATFFRYAKYWEAAQLQKNASTTLSHHDSSYENET